MNETTDLQCNIKNTYFTLQELKALFQGKQIYIWGAGRHGRCLLIALNRIGISSKAVYGGSTSGGGGGRIMAFLDSNPFLKGKSYKNIPILEPESVLSKTGTNKSIFIILAASGEKTGGMIANMQKFKLVHKENYIRLRDLIPFSPSIEISGFCNLKCIACPRGDTEHPLANDGFMSIGDYTKAVKKLIREIPLLHYINLYIWSDPLIHPQIAEFIRINNELGVGTELSTNLNYGKYIKDVIKAGPTHLKISISGIGDHYEITHTGGKWSRLYKNLYAVAKYINKYDSDTNVSINYHANKINLSDYKTIYNLCIKLGFRLDPVVSTIFPCFAMDYIEGKTLPASAIKAKELMLIDLEDIIKKCKTEHNKTCMAARGYPNINWDLSVLTCCNLPYDKLADNYLDISFSDLIDLRNRSPLCTKCIKYSLHRFWQTTYFSNMLYPILTEINNVPPTI